MQLTLKGFRARRIKVSKRLHEFERRRAKYIALADNLSGSVDAAAAELTKIDAAIAAVSDFNTHIGFRERKPRGPRAKRNAMLDEAVVAAVRNAGRGGIKREVLYDLLEAAGIGLPSRKSFAVHLSYMGRDGPITPRNFYWMLKEFAPPLPPPAIEEAERILSERGAASRPEIEAELRDRGVPFTQKSLQTQLSERLRVGKVTFTDGRYALP